MPDDVRWLRYAFRLAEQSVAAGDYAFGAVLVSADDELLAESGERIAETGDWLAHAEVLVLRQAATRWTREQLKGATLYSSTEPCPMCTGAIGWSLNRLVYGLSQAEMYRRFPDPAFPPRFVEPWACHTLLDHTAPPMEVVGPLLEDEGSVAHALWAGKHATGGP